MDFLWRLFSSAIGGFLNLLCMKAANTPEPWDDQVTGWIKKAALIFFPKYTSTWDSNAQVWEPVTGNKKADVFRNAGAVIIKKMMTDPEFLRKSGLTQAQAESQLVLAMSYLKPRAVDTQEEINALVEEVRVAYLPAMPEGDE